MSLKFNDLTSTQRFEVDRQKSRMGDFQQEISQRDEEVARYRAQVMNRDDEMKVFKVRFEQMENSVGDLEEEVEFKCSEINKLRVGMAEAEKTIDDLYLSRKSEGAVTLELEHLKADNQRLLKLLKQTKEYREFSDFVVDSGGNIRYMNSPSKKQKSVNRSSSQYGKENNTTAVDEETEDWIPHEAFKIAH